MLKKFQHIKLVKIFVSNNIFRLTKYSNPFKEWVLLKPVKASMCFNR